MNKNKDKAMNKLHLALQSVLYSRDVRVFHLLPSFGLALHLSANVRSTCSTCLYLPQPRWHNFHDFAYFASLAQLASLWNSSN
jgi:hypothetical protein